MRGEVYGIMKVQFVYLGLSSQNFSQITQRPAGFDTFKIIPQQSLRVTFKKKFSFGLNTPPKVVNNAQRNCLGQRMGQGSKYLAIKFVFVAVGQ